MDHIAARADGRRTKFDWREVRTMNSWSHLMQQHAAHGVRAQSSQLQTRPGLWPPAPEVKPKATSGVLSSCNRRGMPAVCNPTQTPKRPLRASPDPGRHRSNPDRDRRPFRVGGRVPPSSGDSLPNRASFVASRATSIPIGIRTVPARVWTCTQWPFWHLRGLQTAGVPRRLQELKSPEVALCYLWG